MRRNAWGRWIFCAAGLMRILCAVVYTSMIYGRSPGEIARYLRWEMADRGTGPIRLPAVGDDGPTASPCFWARENRTSVTSSGSRRMSMGTMKRMGIRCGCTARTRCGASTPSP